MRENKEIITIAKKIQGKSDRLVVWKYKRWPHHLSIENNNKECCHYQFEPKEYNPETKRLWTYVSEPENKLMYIVKVIEDKGKVPENSNCDNCYVINKKFNSGILSSLQYASSKIHKFAYKLKLLHVFNKGNNLQKIESYKHKKTGKSFKPPQHFIYLSSYPGLIEDIIAGKIE